MTILSEYINIARIAFLNNTKEWQNEAYQVNVSRVKDIVIVSVDDKSIIGSSDSQRIDSRTNGFFFDKNTDTLIGIQVSNGSLSCALSQCKDWGNIINEIPATVKFIDLRNIINDIPLYVFCQNAQSNVIIQDLRPIDLYRLLAQEVSIKSSLTVSNSSVIFQPQLEEIDLSDLTLIGVDWNTDMPIYLPNAKERS